MIAIGVDIGGTSIKGAAVNEKGEVIDVFSMSVEKGENQNVTVNKLIVLIQNYLSEHHYDNANCLGIGFGIPGSIDSEHGIVSYSNNLRWNELHFIEMVSEKIDLPIRITNDANAATLGEYKFGAGRKYKNIIMMTLGTGVGGGLIINGELYEGKMGKGAEIGHSVIKYDGRRCTCGRRGCLEAYASATGLIRDTKRMMAKHKDSKMWAITEKYGKVSARIAFEAAREGDPYGQILVDNYVKYLGEGLNNYFNIFRPDAVVLSGGIANEGDYLISRLKSYCKERNYGFKGTPEVEILISELGYHSGIIGAASLMFK